MKKMIQLLLTNVVFLKKSLFYLFTGMFFFTTLFSNAQSPPGDVVGKITVGYQGWFAIPGDASPYNGWWHWTTDGKIPSLTGSPDNSGIKAWPDEREFSTTFPTALPNLGNGQPANLFSSYTDQTVNTQFLWMEQNGIDCAALQRFDPNGGEGPIRDAMTVKVRAAAEAHNVKFYIMYDVSGWTNMATEMPADWTAKMSAYTASPAYAKQNGKPVVCIWGMGLNDANHPFTSAQCVTVINWFKSQGCYVIGGVRGEWRTANDGFTDTYNAFNMISPWEIGKIGSIADANNYYTNVNVPDQAYCNANGIDYQPCVLPGDVSARQRVHGDFMWTQFYNMKLLGAQGLYISMFDEFNEGNQIAKTAENQSQIPVGSGYLGLDEDGTPVSSDYYLRLTNDGGKMFKGQIPLTATRPTPYFVTGAVPFVTNLSTASGIAGTYLTYNIAASNAPTSFNATGLPAGLSVNTSTGVISGIPTTAGTYTVTVSAANANGSGSAPVTFTIATPAPESAYGGTPWPVPGMIQAENYDIGGQGVAYNDSDPTNDGGQYRTDGVDIENTSDTGGGYDIGFTNAGEWLNYKVNVATTGTYTFQARLATTGTGNTFHVEVDGFNISGSITVPNSGGWQTWETVSFTTPTITSGLHTIRFYEETGGYNINYFNLIELAAAPVISSVATATGIVGAAFSYAVTASNTPTSYAAAGLPSGLSVNTTTGLISGTPTAAGTYTSTVSAINAGGTGTQTVTIIIAPATVAESPYGGAAATIPGTIQAENYDLGGQGVAYNDSDPTNDGGQYRTTEGVDVETTGDTGGGYDVGYTNAGEWMKYTVNVTTTGVYTLQVRVASPGTGNSLHVEFDGVNISGSVAVPNTGNWQVYQTVSVTTPTLTNGQHIIRIYEETGGFNINYISFVAIPAPVISSAATAAGTVGTAFSYTITASNSPTSYTAIGLPAGVSVNTVTGVISGTPTTAGTFTSTVSAINGGGTGSEKITITIVPLESPYGGTAATIPGTIQAENYDLGGQGIAYNDSDPTNDGGQYRTTEGVDVEATGDTGGGYDVGYTAAGEWMKYTVNVITTGVYTLQVRVASPGTGNSLHVESDGVNISGSIIIPNTSNWQVYQTVSVTTPVLTSGQHIIRIYEETGGFNINYISFVAVQAPVITSAATATGTVGVAFNYTITASNTPTSYAATGLPAGLSVNTTTGVISGTPTASGIFIVTISAINAAGTATKAISLTINTNTSPYGGTAAAIPGTIQAENYDLGGEGVAYHNNDAVNQGGAYRTDGVDIESTADNGGGYDVGWTAAGEWLKYTVNIATAGTYTIGVRSAGIATGAISLSLDGTDLAGTVNLPNTGGWQTWTTVTVPNVTLPAGPHVMEILMASSGFNLNYLTVTSSAGQRIGIDGVSASNADVASVNDPIINIYPNPIITASTVDLVVAQEGNVKAIVYDKIGNEAGTIVNAYLTKGTHLYTFDASHLSDGLYLIKFTINDQVFTRKIVKIQ